MSGNFEDKVRHLLSPLADVNTCIHFPLIANTFPIAYYYSKVLKGTAHWEELDMRLKQRDWNNKLITKSELEKSPCHLFFATGDGDEFKQGDDYNVEKIPFSNYFPRFLFTDYSSRIVTYLEKKNKLNEYFDKRRDFSDKELGEEGSFMYFTEIFSKDLINALGIKQICLFTDTENEAEYIKDHFLVKLVDKVQIVPKNCTNIPLNSTLNSNNVLRLYFFSAPYNMYFLKELFNYIPFQFKADEIKNNFATFNFLVYDKAIPVEKINSIKNNVSNFHTSIFSEAANNPENLSNVYHSYNELSKTSEPFKILDDVHAFSKCLVFHTLDKCAKGDGDATWMSLKVTDRASKYSRDYVDLRTRVKNAYTILSLHHLSSHYNLVSIQSKNYPDVIKLLKDSILMDGKYSIYFRDYIKAELVVLINKYASVDNSPVKNALDKLVDNGAILHNMLYHSVREFFDSEYKFISTKDIIETNDKHFKIILQFSNLRNQLMQSKVHYANTAVLIETVNIIEDYYMRVLDTFEGYKGDHNINTFFLDEMRSHFFTEAFSKLKAKKGYA